MPGPLALALLALFGPGSFSKIAQSIKTADDAVSRTLCQTVPFHFENWQDGLEYVDSIGQGGDIHPSVCSYAARKRDPETGLFTDEIDWRMKENWQDVYLDDLVARLGITYADYWADHTKPPPADFSGVDATASPWLSMAMHFANQALLDIASTSYYIPTMPNSTAYGGHQKSPTGIWNVPGLEYNKPSVSAAGVIVVSVLLGLQVLGILFLMGYIYSIPTWTDTLDSLAIARIAHQLPDEDQDLLKEIGLRRARSTEVEKLGAVVGEEASAKLLPARDEGKKAPDVSESAV